MTADEYWAVIRSWGFIPLKKVTPLNWIVKDRDGEIHSVPGPDEKTPDERCAEISLLRGGLG